MDFLVCRAFAAAGIHLAIISSLSGCYEKELAAAVRS